MEEITPELRSSSSIDPVDLVSLLNVYSFGGRMIIVGDALLELRMLSNSKSRLYSSFMSRVILFLVGGAGKIISGVLSDLLILT